MEMLVVLHPYLPSPGNGVMKGEEGVKVKEGEEGDMGYPEGRVCDAFTVPRIGHFSLGRCTGAARDEIC